MTATGELLNLPVAIPMRSVAAAFSLPQRQIATRYAHPQRVYPLSHREGPDAFRYGADGHPTTAPDKGSLIDLFV